MPDRSNYTKSEKVKLTLTVHHRNYLVKKLFLLINILKIITTEEINDLARSTLWQSLDLITKWHASVRFVLSENVKIHISWGIYDN